MRRLSCGLFFVLTGIASAQKGDPTYDKALAYFEQKNYDACITAIRPAIKDNARPELRVLVAHCHTGKKNYADAAAHLKVVAEEAPDYKGVKEDIVAVLFAQGKYREARKAGYRYIEALKDDGKTIPAELYLATARAELAYGKPTAALQLAREAKQTASPNTKYQGLITEARALMALGNFSEADISLSYAESMRNSELHALLRANIAELSWAQQKFPEDKRAEIVALYEKISRSENAEIKSAATKNLERVKTVKSP